MNKISNVGSVFSNIKHVRWNFWPILILMHRFRCNVFKSQQRFHPPEWYLLHLAPQGRSFTVLLPNFWATSHSKYNQSKPGFVPAACEHARSWFIHTKSWHSQCKGLFFTTEVNRDNEGRKNCLVHRRPVAFCEDSVVLGFPYKSE